MGVIALATLGAGPVLPPLGDPIARLPLDPPVVPTGGFGETRSNHFHAGFDFATNGRTGLPVYAPLGGWVERVRTSGVGYGRSLYLHTPDGRLLVFGHLDAFTDPLAAWVDSVQRSTGDYEQDLWPAAGRFRVASGQQIAWSGSSGAGGPHLHVEVRRGDFALHPLRSGYPALRPAAPRLDSVTIDPVDDSSFVSRLAAPVTRRLGPAAETLVVEGRVRATIKVEDTAEGGPTTPVWSTSATWKGETTEVRFDSLSWATDMAEIDHVVDRGRVSGSRGLVLHAAPGFRPRVLRSPQPIDRDAGVIAVKPGDPPARLDLVAREPGGAEVRRAIWLRGPRAGELGPDSLRAGGGGATPSPRWSFASLPDRGLRVRVTGVPAGLTRVWIVRGREFLGARRATWDGGGWSAVLHMAGIPDEEGFWLRGRLPNGQTWITRGSFVVWPAGADLPIEPEDGVHVEIPLAAVFERGTAVTTMGPRQDAPAQGLVARSPVLRLGPESLPLRASAKVRLKLGVGAERERVAIYRRTSGEDWSWLDSAWDADARTFLAYTSRLGEFALFADAVPPRVQLLAAPALPATAKDGYSRWALTASVTEAGSGVVGALSGMRVDGRAVPVEWDPEANALRWRPRVPPEPGPHDIEVTAVDHAGNRGTVKRTITLRRVLTSGARR